MKHREPIGDTDFRPDASGYGTFTMTAQWITVPLL